MRVKKNEITKPEFKKAINYIAKSTSKNILIDGSLNHEIDYNVIKNYLSSLNKSLIIKDKIDYLDKKIWKLCYLPITDFNCDISNNKKNIREIDDKDYNLIIEYSYFVLYNYITFNYFFRIMTYFYIFS